MATRSHKDLRVWRDAMLLARVCYQATECFPRGELFGLVSQIRRAAVSVPSNIAEGSSRLSPGDYRRFLAIANGSLSELETQLLLARDLGYLAADASARCLSLASTTGRRLRALRAAIEVVPKR